jgi:hypothetical protein
MWPACLVFETPESLPSSATASTVTPFWKAIKPSTLNMTNPAKKLVIQLIIGTIIESLHYYNKKACYADRENMYYYMLYV